MDEKAYVGIDIGGTKVNIGKVQGGKIIQEILIPTLPIRPEDQIISDIVDATKQFIDDDVKGIGIGVPGIVDDKKGIIYNLTNIPSWKEVHLKEKFEKEFQLPVQIANDANCFTLGENVYGKGKGHANMVGITLGTGLGTGIVINNQVYAGRLSIAGELASMPYLDGNYEDYCSSKFFICQYELTAKEVYDNAIDGDSEAREIFDLFGKHLAKFIELIVLAYGPDCIIMGGSIASAWDLFSPSLKKHLESFPHQNVLKDIILSDFTHSKISLMGAAALSMGNKQD